MPNIKSPLQKMINEHGQNWEFVAYLGLEHDWHMSACKLFLHRKGGANGGNGAWWRFEDTVPFMTGRTQSPFLNRDKCKYLMVSGDVQAFPAWLACDPTKPALLEAVEACRNFSRYCQSFGDSLRLLDGEPLEVQNTTSTTSA